MKFFKKSIITFLVIGTVSLGYSENVQACKKSPNCYAIETIIKCDDVHLQEGSHKVTEPNGYESYCTISVLSGPHKIMCAGCGVVLSTEWRTCFEKHSNPHCYSKENLCK